MNSYTLKLSQSITGLLLTIGLFSGLAIESHRLLRRTTTEPAVTVGQNVVLATPIVSENPTDSASPTSLEGTSWILVNWRTENNSNLLETTEPITANFVEGQVKGNASCNRYISSYKTEGNQLQITPGITTRKTCMGEIMERESAYLDALEGVQQYEMNDQGQLLISYTTEQGSGVMTFTPQAIGQLETQTWVLVSLEEATISRVPLKETEITVNFTEDQVRGMGSCNQYMTNYTKEGNKLSINPLATTRKACPSEIMRQEFEYLTALEKAQWYEISPQGQLKISYQAQGGSGVMTFTPQQIER